LAVGLDAASEVLVEKLLRDPKDASFRFAWRGVSDFEAPATEMISLLRDKKQLIQMLLIYSYVTVEAFAADVLIQYGEPRESVETGIEAWSSKIMTLVKLPWSKVKGGKLALMEAAFKRNAIVHGLAYYSKAEARRCGTSKVYPSWKEGDVIPLEVSDLLSARYSLQCFMRVVSQRLRIANQTPEPTRGTRVAQH
jgi:hypothetical protein